MKIKIFARSFDLRLYEQSRAFYAGMGYDCVRMTDTTADGYFYQMLADEDCDIAINVDEDCFIANPEAVKDLVDFAIKNGYANIGCPDGGGFCPRHGNPVVTNPFFNIFNLRMIREKAGNASAIRQAVKQYNYDNDKERLIANYPQERLQTKFNFNNQGYVEPYYPFFLWLAGNFTTYYLPSETHQDGITTILFDNQNRMLCAHSWFARFYSTPTFFAKFVNKNSSRQKKRIDALIDEIHSLRADSRPVTLPSDECRYLADKIVRWSIKVPQRIAGWPAKLKKRLSGKDRWSL